MKQKRLTIILGVILAIIIAAFSVVMILNKPKEDDGKKEITVTVVYADKTEKEYKITTQAGLLADALLEKQIVTEQEYKSGYYTIINGIKADYNSDKAWWAVYEKGEMANVGMNDLVIEDGDLFEIVYTVG